MRIKIEFEDIKESIEDIVNMVLKYSVVNQNNLDREKFKEDLLYHGVDNNIE